VSSLPDYALPAVLMVSYQVSFSLALFWRILQVSVTLATRQVPLDTGLTDLGKSVDFQHPLATEDEWLYGFEPSMLTPVPLAVNGNSTNRVNIVYFGDGCEYSTIRPRRP
jgi:hypothetical protein